MVRLYMLGMTMLYKGSRHIFFTQENKAFVQLLRVPEIAQILQNPPPPQKKSTGHRHHRPKRRSAQQQAALAELMYISRT